MRQVLDVADQGSSYPPRKERSGRSDGKHVAGRFPLGEDPRGSRSERIEEAAKAANAHDFIAAFSVRLFFYCFGVDAVSYFMPSQGFVIIVAARRIFCRLI